MSLKVKKIGNVNDNNEPELFTRKNKKYIDEFNDYMKKLQERIGGSFAEGVDNETNEEIFYENITNDSISEIQNKIDNIIDENNLKNL